MQRAQLFIAASLLASMALLAFTPESVGAPYRAYPAYRSISPYRAEYHSYPANHMPGWDWRQIYPWSPYNYGRNPYNPAVVPYPAYYPYVNPYSAYTPPPAYYSGYSGLIPLADGAMVPSSQRPQVQIPQPTGGYTVPPADAAVVEVRVPDTMTQVEFNGQRTYTTGLNRWFVTPDLQVGKTYTYAVTATWTQNGQPVTRERQVTVTRGHTSFVDFSQAMNR